MHNRGYKYKYVIAPLLQIKRKKKSGRGLPRAMTLNDNAIDYVHWDDPNELVDRLRLLEASCQGSWPDVTDYWGTLRNWFYYKLTCISSKRISRSMITLHAKMPINKFGLFKRRNDDDDSYLWNKVRNYMRNNALCRVATDYNAKIRRVRFIT